MLKSTFLILCVLSMFINVSQASYENYNIDWKWNMWASNCDFPGKDYKHVISTSEQCGGICENDLTSVVGLTNQIKFCTHFTWGASSPGAKTGTCWLKHVDDPFITPLQAKPATEAVCGIIEQNFRRYWATQQFNLFTQSFTDIYLSMPKGAYGYKIFRLKNSATNRCLDSNSAREVYSLPCNGGDFQLWLFIKRPDGYLFIVNAATALYLYADYEGGIRTAKFSPDPLNWSWTVLFDQNRFKGIVNMGDKTRGPRALDSHPDGRIYGNYDVNNRAFQTWIPYLL